MSSSADPGIADRVAEVRERIASACRIAGREISEVKLLAVSKGHSIEAVRAVAAEGILDFGENYLAELNAKGSAAPELNWYFQGAVQRRKVKEIVKIARSILSVARAEELLEIDRRAENPVGCFIEVNIARELSKGGVDPDQLGALIDSSSSLTKVKIEGIMVIPPAAEESDDAAKWFDAARELSAKHRFRQISMGMSNDFETAIRCGSTMVRIGTAIFGPRTYKN